MIYPTFQLLVRDLRVPFDWKVAEEDVNMIAVAAGGATMSKPNMFAVLYLDSVEGRFRILFMCCEVTRAV